METGDLSAPMAALAQWVEHNPEAAESLINSIIAQAEARREAEQEESRQAHVLALLKGHSPRPSKLSTLRDAIDALERSGSRVAERLRADGQSMLAEAESSQWKSEFLRESFAKHAAEALSAPQRIVEMLLDFRLTVARIEAREGDRVRQADLEPEGPWCPYWVREGRPEPVYTDRRSRPRKMVPQPG